MRSLLIWAFIAALAFVGYAMSSHSYLTENPHRVLVVVDASAAMQSDWPTIKSPLAALDSSARYTTFALGTQRDLIHTWSEHLNLGHLRPGGERELDTLNRAAHLPATPADRKILITNASPETLSHLPEWEILNHP